MQQSIEVALQHGIDGIVDGDGAGIPDDIEHVFFVHRGLAAAVERKLAQLVS
ncbi:hypothetical protein D3C71_2159110 [compost metagenome]